MTIAASQSDIVPADRNIVLAQARGFIHVTKLQAPTASFEDIATIVADECMRSQRELQKASQQAATNKKTAGLPLTPGERAAMNANPDEPSFDDATTGSPAVFAKAGQNDAEDPAAIPAASGEKAAEKAKLDAASTTGTATTGFATVDAKAQQAALDKAEAEKGKTEAK